MSAHAWAEDFLNPIQGRAFEAAQEAYRYENPAVGDRHHLYHRIARRNRHPEGNLLASVAAKYGQGPKRGT
jgi:hypothetical protein